MMSFDLSKFAIQSSYAIEETFNEGQIEQVRLEQPAKRMRKRFICPMDLAWFLRARAIAPMAAIMACCLWYRYGLERTPTIHVTRHKLDEFRIGKSSSRRILRHMEEAHLVSIQWHKTRAPEVTIVLKGSSSETAPPRETRHESQDISGEITKTGPKSAIERASGQ